MPNRLIRAYRTQYGRSSSVAPRKSATLVTRRFPTIVKTKPTAMTVYIIREKISFARFLLPVPSVTATSALPPEPSIKPTAEKIMIYGMIRLRAAKGVAPTKLDTKKPSTTP